LTAFRQGLAGPRPRVAVGAGMTTAGGQIAHQDAA
jgi:hypothetical protein